MANLKSSKKAIRQNKTRALRNLAIKREIKKLMKEVRDLALKGDSKKAQELFQKATKKIDKTAKSNFIHKNTASRYKSRLAKAINKAEKK
jgi:small subunit ribosomal protein S20